MLCTKCKEEIPDESRFCLFCGKSLQKQERKTLKRPNGAGNVSKLSGRRKKPWVVRISRGVNTGNGSTIRIPIGYYGTKTEAMAALDNALTNPITSKYNMTVSEIYDEWSSSHFKELSKDGISGYKTAWNYLKKYQDIKMREIRTGHFQSVIDDAINLGRSRAVCEKVKQLCSQLSKYAMQNDIINKNYANFVKLPKSTTKEKEIFTDKELSILFENDNKEDVKIILSMIYTGFRIGEFFGILKENVNIKDGYITGGFKTEAGTNRVVPISRKILSYISSWYNASNSNYLLPNENGCERDIANFRKRNYYTTLESLGIRKLTPHATRHTFASLMSKANVKPELLQSIIGHADYATTANIYIHNDLEQLKKAIDLI